MTVLDGETHAALLESLLCDARERLARIEAGDDGRRQAHTLAGAAATVGLPRLERLARRLELALDEGPESAGEALEAAAAELETVASRLRTVVCIDDDPTSRLLVERLASHCAGVRILSAGSGAAGLALVRGVRPDLVLLDLRLPDLGGKDVLRSLRAEPATASIPVVIASGDAARADELRADGAREVLTKPIDTARLLALLGGR